MITIIFLLCVTLAQVSSNPLLQALAQTCPICQQNALKNPLAAALPMLFQQPPQNQPYPQGIMPENAWPMPISQPNVLPCPMCPSQNRFCPCPPNNCHHQPPYPPQNVRHSNNQGNSDFLNMLLSNPTIKSILDPNTKMYTQNGIEVPKNGMCKNGAQQVINNYIIVPDLLQEDGKCVPKEGKKVNDGRASNGKRRRRPKQNNGTREEQSKTAPTDVIIDLKPFKDTPRSIAVPDEEDKPLEKKYIGRISVNGTEGLKQRKRRRRKKNRNPNIKVQVVSGNGTEINNQTETPLSTITAELISAENKSLYTTTEAHTLEPTITEHPQFLENTKDSHEVITESVKDHVNNIDSNVDKQVKEDMSPVQINENFETTTSGIDVDIMSEIQIQSPQESSTARPEKPRNKHQQNKNPREEAVIADFKKKFPNIPENVVRDLIDHMARQIQSQNLGIPAYFSQHPINYEQLLGNHFNHEVTIPVYLNNKQNKYRNENKRRNKQSFKKKENIIDITKVESERETIQITEKPTTIKIFKSTTPLEEVTATPEIVTELTVTAKNVKEVTTLKPFEDSRSIEDEYTTNDHEYENVNKADNIFATYKHEDDNISELGTEDMVPIFYVNGLGEYYPDFQADNQFFSYEDYSYLNPEDERYYYTTDKNYSLKELNRERRKYESNLENVAKNSENRLVFKVRQNRRKTPKSNLRRRPVSKATTTITTVRPKVLKSVLNRPKVIVTVEQSTEKAREIEEIQFKTPPTLEKIDFETKPVNKNFYFRDDDYKISTYSDFKTPQYVNDKSTSMKQKAADKIETVYAQSKVVKYGQSHSDETFGRTDLANESNLFSTDDKTIVMAKHVSGDYW